MTKNLRVLEEIEDYLKNVISYLYQIETSVEEDTLSEKDYDIVFSAQESFYQLLDNVQKDIEEIKLKSPENT